MVENCDFALKYVTMHKIKTNYQFSKILILLLLTFFVVSKTFVVAHNSEHSLQHLASDNIGYEDCEICSFANSQSQLVMTPNFMVVLTSFILLILVRKFDSVKLSYLLSSKSSRAPPFNS